MSAATALFGAHPPVSRLLYSRTLVIGVDRNEFWQEKLPAQGLDVSKILSLLRTQVLDVWVYEDAAEKSRIPFLSVKLDSDRVLAGPKNFLPSILLLSFGDLRPSPTVDELNSVDVCVVIDRQLPSERCPNRKLSFSRVMDGDLVQYRSNRPIPLLDHLAHDPDSAQSTTIEPGWHRLDVEVRVGSRRFAEVVYFEAIERRASLVLGGNSLLRDEARSSAPRTIEERRAELAVEPQQGGLNRAQWHPLPSALVPSCIKPASGPPAELRNCLQKSDVLVLVEPSLSELLAIDMDAPLAFRAWLQRGGTVLVLGAPVINSGDASEARAADQLEWLPAVAEARHRSDPKLVHYDSRLYLLPDSGRLLQIPLSANARDNWRHLRDPHTDDITPMLIQRRLMQAVLSRLEPVTNAGAWRQGRLPTEAGSRPRSIALPPPIVLDVSAPEMASLKDRFAADVAGSSISLRVGALLEGADAEAARPYPLLRPGDEYPGSIVLLFLTDAARTQRLPPGMVIARKGDAATLMSGTGPSPWSELAGEPGLQTARSCHDLKAMGIRIFVVRLPLWEEAVKPPGSTEGCPEGIEIANLTTAYRDVDIRRAADAIVGLFTERADVRWAWSGRVLDPRVAPVRDQPIPTIQVLRRTPINGPASLDVFAPPVASVHRDRTAAASSAARPLVVQRRYGDGRVVVNAYSPFGSDVWSSDLTPMENENIEAARARGWGLQRIFDSVVRMPSLNSASGDVAPIRVEAAPGDTGLFFMARLPLGTLREFERPVLEVDGQSHPFELIDIDVSAGTARFFVSTDVDVRPAAGRIKFKNGNEIPIFVTLVKRPSAGTGDPVKALGELAVASGGGLLDSSHLPDRRLGAQFVGSLGLLLLGAVMLSPIVRPYGAFLGWWGRKHSWVRSRRVPVRITAGMIVEALGRRAATLEASRRAGLPAWSRPYETGDSLLRARTRDLFTYTALARSRGIRPTIPKVHQRQIEENFETILIIDAGDSLRVPEPQVEFGRSSLIIQLGLLIAETVWSQQSSVLVLRAARNSPIYGPWQKKDAGRLESLLGSWVGANGRLDRSEFGIPETKLRRQRQFVILISDLLSADTNKYVELYTFCASNDFRLRVIAVSDPDDSSFVGIGKTPNGRIIDRSEWTRTDLRNALLRRRLNLRSVAEQSGGIHVDISTDTPPYEVIERLIQSSFFTDR